MQVGEHGRHDRGQQAAERAHQEAGGDAGPRRRRQAEQGAAAREPGDAEPQGASPPEPSLDPIAQQAHQDDADRDRARMQRHRAIAERELRLQERHDIALQVDGVEIEAGEEPAVPGGANEHDSGELSWYDQQLSCPLEHS
jgi:hypothetical protein